MFSLLQAAVGQGPNLRDRDWNTTSGAAGYVISSLRRLKLSGHVPNHDVISGMILHPIAQAREVLKFYRDFVVSGLPDELTALSNGGSPQSQ